MLVKLHAQDLAPNDRLEITRPAHMRPRPELHETKTDYYKTETKTKKSVETTLVSRS